MCATFQIFPLSLNLLWRCFSPSVLGRNVKSPFFFCDYESEIEIWSAPLLFFLENATT